MIGLLAGRAGATPLDPSSPLFTANSQGDVTLTGGTNVSYVFNLGTATPTLTRYDGAVFNTVATGFVYNGINVFDFRSFTVGAGVSVGVNQSSASGPIALLSSTSIVVAGSINVSATGNPIVPGGPGAANTGVGGNGSTGSTGSTGPGGTVASGGGGGGFGGAGMAGGSTPTNASGTAVVPGGAGGAATANLASRLQGGSMGGFGGGAGFGSSILPGAPGFGGGAIELGAVGSVTISGSILANGSNAIGQTAQGIGGGGGGSGGGVLVHGNSVALSGSITAVGGAGAPSFYPTASGGMGGGGQVLIAYNEQGGSFSNTGTVNVGTGATAGRFDAVPLTSVPEPSSLALLGAAVLAGAGWASARRNRA